MEDENILVLAAMPQELDYHRKILRESREESEGFMSGLINGRRVVLGLTGVGTNMAAATTKYAITKFSPKVIIFTGVGGSLDNGVGIGNIGVIESAINYQTDLRGFNSKTYSLGQQLFEEEHTRISKSDKRLLSLVWDYIKESPNSKEFFRGYSATGDRFLISDSQSIPPGLKYLTKQYFNENLSPLLEDKIDGNILKPNCCDMETEAIMKQANNAKIPIVAFRLVSDQLNGDAVTEFNGFLDKGIEKYGPIVEHLIKKL